MIPRPPFIFDLVTKFHDVRGGFLSLTSHMRALAHACLMYCESYQFNRTYISHLLETFVNTFVENLVVQLVA
jgi:hypothetical protein